MTLAQALVLSTTSSVLLNKFTTYGFGCALLVFTFQISVYLAWLSFIYPRFFSPLRHLPTPPTDGKPFSHTRLILSEPTGVPLAAWVDSVPNDGLIRYSMWLSERVLVTNPKALGDVLVTRSYDFVKPPRLVAGLGRILGIGVLLAEGDEHKRQRKMLMPAFAYRHIKDLYPLFWRKSAQLVDCLSTASKTGVKEEGFDLEDVPSEHAPGSVEVGHWVSRATLDIIGEAGMGQTFQALHNPSNEIYQTYRTVFNPGRAGRILQIMSTLLPTGLIQRIPLKRNEEMNSASAHIEQVCRNLIAAKRRSLESDTMKNSDLDIISVALSSGGFTDESLANQMMTFLAAGHETTATAMTWAIYLLCKHPQAQTRLREEIRNKLPDPRNGSETSTPSPAELDGCEYLHAFCAEVLRLWAPVPLTLRVAARDTIINGHAIPKGTFVILSTWAVNTSVHLWGKDAKEFSPDRWLSPTGKFQGGGGAQSVYAFMTFLHGPRSCIGEKFAWAEFSALLAAWVGSFETSFEPGSALDKGEKVDIKSGITARPKGGVWVKLNETERW
ncbi:cytochrome P450 78A3 [Piedraia hortae CBS 480.64]|uniref:Cytochrome P450 78A3 n=1 Tax=Piedraia hortae CBS 480.64 TaxID=1314780 RepID=A0A6A7BR19_9PEZI|nr:cytochrome P450 78A3 [Piedraia hortae CBS 480.64]